MIKILEDREQKFLDYLNANYDIGVECTLSVFNLQDTIGVGENGEEQSFFSPEADLIMLTTVNPPDGIFDCEGNPAPKFYEDNYTLLKLAHEYGHFLQKYGKIPNPEDLEENEREADKFAHKVVEEFIETEK